MTVYCDNLGLSKEGGRYFELLGLCFSELKNSLVSRFEHELSYISLLLI